MVAHPLVWFGSPRAIDKCREETGHVLAHNPDDTPASSRELKEVEAESIAFIVAATLGLDTSAYSFPYVAHWAHDIGTLDAVQSTAERVIGHARTILTHLET